VILCWQNWSHSCLELAIHLDCVGIAPLDGAKLGIKDCGIMTPPRLMVQIRHSSLELVKANKDFAAAIPSKSAVRS
jgi:hypothetical protein